MSTVPDPSGGWSVCKCSCPSFTPTLKRASSARSMRAKPKRLRPLGTNVNLCFVSTTRAGPRRPPTPMYTLGPRKLRKLALSVTVPESRRIPSSASSAASRAAALRTAENTAKRMAPTSSSEPKTIVTAREEPCMPRRFHDSAQADKGFGVRRDSSRRCGGG